MNLLRSVYRTWFTGVLYCLAGAGYVLYTVLVVCRMIQTKKIITVVAVFLALLLGVIAYGFYLFVPLQEPGEEVVLVVEPGTTVRTVAKLLDEKKVIPDALPFLLWMKVTKREKSMQAGRYTFRMYEGIISAARKLESAEPIEEQVTVPEGFTIEQTAVCVAEVFAIDTAAFVRLCHDTAFIKKLGIDVPSLEGYLFPDTYRFPPDAAAEEIITRMVQQFVKVYNSIKSTDVQKKYTRHEIVTLASIVEEEATLAEERTRISGVFHNRLRRGIPLGADPTVRYALKKFDGPLRVSELNNPSPYNTRIHTGLTPGPICSPGKGALEAAIRPMETKELYFVAKWDGTGAHDFSVTNAQHDRKKREIRRQNYLRKLEAKKGK